MMTTSEKYLQLGKEQMRMAAKTLPKSRENVEYIPGVAIEYLSTEIAQELSNHLTPGEAIELLMEHPEFYNKESRWPEVESQYFTVHWVLVHLLTDWLDDELETWGKEHLCS